MQCNVSQRDWISSKSLTRDIRNTAYYSSNIYNTASLRFNIESVTKIHTDALIT